MLSKSFLCILVLSMLSTRVVGFSLRSFPGLFTSSRVASYSGRSPFSSVRTVSSSRLYDNITGFQPGDKIQVEIVSFGPMGASVDVISRSHDPNDLIPESEPPLATGLVLQREIAYFRQSRNNVDVVRGEVLPAYVERTRDDGKVDVALRAFGGHAKATELADQILARLQEAPGNTIRVGDKSDPRDVAREFPGVSKASFKRAVANLYKAGKVQPSPESISLMKKK